MPERTIVFVHGLFMTNRCWNQWADFFEAKGYTCLALPYPRRDQSVEALRKAHPDPALGRLTLEAVIESYQKSIRVMAEPPVLIGHSLGGLIVQVLLQGGVGAAGVAIDSAPPLGVLTTQWSFVKSNWPILNPVIPSSEPYFMPFEDFEYAFVNGLAPAEQHAAYDQQVVPESRRLGRGVLSNAARVDFKRKTAPLLMFAGSSDHIIPAGLNRTNFAKYKNNPSVTEFKEFPGRTHYGIGQMGWEEMAGFVAAWLEKQKL
jgi:pimeloyl-ACP methyl ester carboxylesterase